MKRKQNEGRKGERIKKAKLRYVKRKIEKGKKEERKIRGKRYK